MVGHLQSKALVATRRSPSSERDIVVTGLGKHYGAVQVLHDVSFTLRDGEFLTLLGPSGSGKTTSLGVIAGFVEPDQGDVQVAGKSIVTLPPREKPRNRVPKTMRCFRTSRFLKT